MTKCCDFSVLKEWIDTAQPNSKIIYFTGQGIGDSILSTQIGNYVYQESTKGKVYLVRKRTHEMLGEFDYMCIKASRPPVDKLVPFSDEKLKDYERIYRGRNRHLKSKQLKGATNGTVERIN